jgi:hypothetical protein
MGTDIHMYTEWWQPRDEHSQQLGGWRFGDPIFPRSYDKGSRSYELELDRDYELFTALSHVRSYGREQPYPPLLTPGAPLAPSIPMQHLIMNMGETDVQRFEARRKPLPMEPATSEHAEHKRPSRYLWLGDHDLGWAYLHTLLTAPWGELLERRGTADWMLTQLIRAAAHYRVRPNEFRVVVGYDS